MRLAPRRSADPSAQSRARASDPVPARGGGAAAKAPAFERHIHGFVAMTLGREIVGGVSDLVQVLPEKDKALRPALLVGIQVAHDRGAQHVLR